VRVLFVSDTHLGFDLPSRPRGVRRRRGKDFFDNFERALEPARRGEVDVVVHGGDLLYRSRVPLWLAERSLAPLERVAFSGVPVLLVPGNHERARGPYPLLALHDQLHIFDRPRTIVFESRGVRSIHRVSVHVGDPAPVCGTIRGGDARGRHGGHPRVVPASMH
jgi:DNA repair exonuclease SbcCD nuclease subunit